jgi:hypothetical protein
LYVFLSFVFGKKYKDIKKTFRCVLLWTITCLYLESNIENIFFKYSLYIHGVFTWKKKIGHIWKFTNWRILILFYD